MRMTVICGIDHINEDERNEEVRRILADLSKQIYTKSKLLKPGDVFILRDQAGNRVGVVDITER